MSVQRQGPRTERVWCCHWQDHRLPASAGPGNPGCCQPEPGSHGWQLHAGLPGSDARQCPPAAGAHWWSQKRCQGRAWETCTPGKYLPLSSYLVTILMTIVLDGHCVKMSLFTQVMINKQLSIAVMCRCWPWQATLNHCQTQQLAVPLRLSTPSVRCPCSTRQRLWLSLPCSSSIMPRRALATPRSAVIWNLSISCNKFLRLIDRSCPMWHLCSNFAPYIKLTVLLSKKCSASKWW